MAMLRMLKNFLVMLILTLLWGCVGTVEDAKLKLNDLFQEDTIKLDFVGIEEARPVSHDKVEIEFTPHPSGDSNLKYLLYINGNSSAVEINPDSLNDAIAGRKLYLVDGLNINTSYKFLLRLKNTVTGAESKNEQEKTVKTFDNRTANFRGVTSVSKITGQSATSVRVEWVPAQMDGLITAQQYDPVYYEVTIIGAGGAQNLNNNAYSGNDKRVIPVPSPPTLIAPSTHSQFTSIVIDSLTPNTEYAIQVRAVNKLWHFFDEDPNTSVNPVDREANTKFLKIKTNPVDGNFEFNRESLQVINAPGLDALTKVNTYWSPGTGTFTGYRLYYKKFSQAAATRDVVEATDELNQTQMIGLHNGSIAQSDDNGKILSITPDKTSTLLTMLTAYRWYQFKIVLCKTAACPVDPMDLNYGRVSELRFVRTQPTLAPFSGVTKIDSPKSATDLDMLNLTYEAPALTVGYADELEVFCIDPATYNPSNPSAIQYVQLGTTPAVSSIPNCNGLQLDALPLLTETSLRVKGVKAMPKFSATVANYCFAIYPAIRQQAEQLPPLASPPKSDWIVRCLNPEIKTPTIVDYPGVKGSCGVVQNNLTVSWDAPKGGIFTDYKVFWRKIEGAETFRFSDAVANDANYSSATVPGGTLTYTISGLRPGTRYRVGVLTSVNYEGDVLYSEHNVNIKDCVTTMPVATFEEWTRIFAVGPKIDGRVPIGSTAGKRFFQDSSKIYEALNVDGIPYEVALDGGGNPIPTSIERPPGNYSAASLPTHFGNDFDGAKSKVGAIDYAMSNNGIISIAWKEVKLSFLENEFKECQFLAGQAAPARTECQAEKLKNTRKYGYKVFRSEDNRLTWLDVTGSGSATGLSLVYGGDYKFYRQSDEDAVVSEITEVTERMAFFTDYSVRAMITDPESTERARVYWYKVVPYFDGKPLSFNDAALVPSNQIKVVLPPFNSALVHRMMANLKACSDIGRYEDINKQVGGHYSCDYNGVGARPKGSPWAVDKTVIDQGGDLLVDRFEMGCQYTRGDFRPIPNAGSQSFFDRPDSFDEMGFKSKSRSFTGFSTDDSGVDVAGSKFMGCTNGRKWGGGSLVAQDREDEEFEPSYKKYLYGDCIGTGTMTIASGACADSSRVSRLPYSFPGAFSPIAPLTFDCTNNANPDTPQHAGTMFSESFRRNILFQSEFAAVYHHRTTDGTSYSLNPLTTDGAGGHTSSLIYDSWDNGRRAKSCFINLAAIGSDLHGSSKTWRSRWFPTNDLDKVKDGAWRTNILTQTVSQVLSDPDLYSGTSGEYQVPDTTFTTSNRYDLNTRIGRIFSSNSAKLPGLTGMPISLAQSVCQLHEVDVGFSTDATNFLPFGFPKPKRLMGRPEQISAAAWPEAATNPSGYNYSEARITTLEIGDTPNSCVGATRNLGDDGLIRDSYITSSRTTPFLLASSAPLFTGSSKADVHPTDTTYLRQSSLCTSRYGIQDLVGNYAELSPEVLFCDYDKDKVLFGQYGGSNPYIKDGIGSVLNSVVLPNSWEDYLTVIYDKTPIVFLKADGTVDRTVGGANPTPPYNQNIGWADLKPESGYCSLVDSTEAFADDPSRFRDSNDIFYNIFNPDGSLNTSMVSRAQLYDQASVDRMRNGDGFYLNFGADNLGPIFRDANSLSISGSGITTTTNTALGPYFNPITGFPISCGDDECDSSPDNKLVSTTFLNAKATDPAKIGNFPIGNSQIFNTGVSDWSYYSSVNTPTFFIEWDALNPPNPNTEMRIVDHIEVSSTGAVTFRYKTVVEFVADYGYGKFFFTRPQFAIRRGSPLGFLYGGSYASTKSGRFTANNVVATNHSYSTISSQGFRCSVLINTD